MADYRTSACTCPACRSLMDERRILDAVVDVCPTCHGLWIDWFDGDLAHLTREAGSPLVYAPASGSGASGGTGGATSPSVGGTGASGAAAGGAAAGGVAAGVAVAKEAAVAGPRMGRAVGDSAGQHTEGAQATPTAPSGAPMPQVADSVPAGSRGTER